MRVKVKENMNGFIYGVYRSEGDEITLKNPDAEFSDKWMDKIESAKPVVKDEPVKNKPGPKPKRSLETAKE